MKISKQIIFIFILLTVSLASQVTVCPQNTLRDNIQTGIIQFTNIKQRQSCKQVDVTFNSNGGKLQIAASVVSTQNYYVANGVDYAIKVGSKNSNKFTATLISDFNANWTKITVSYIATTRVDMFTGSFLTDSFQTLKCLEADTVQNKLQVSSVVPAWNKDFLNAKAIVFISGVKTISSTISSLKVGTVQLNASGILNVQITSAHGLQIQFIQLSYILISLSFPFQHGYELNHPEYAFPLWEQFKDNKLVQSQWGIYTESLICEGSQCTKTCLSNDECTSLLGNSLNGHCFICDKGKIWDGDNCISICNTNEVWNVDQCSCILNAIRIKSLCVICPANSTPNKLQTQCICNDGFIWNNWKSSCLPFNCPVNSQPKCNQGGVDCICKVGFYKSSDVCKLIPDCPSNSVFDVNQKKCVCSLQNQFMSVNGVCISCSKNQTWDQSSKKCQCKPNFISVSGSCVACPAYSTLNLEKTKCVCNQGFIWSDWKVACIPFKCPQNSVPVCFQSGVQCNCKDGMYMNGDNCDIIPKCPFGASFDFNKKICVCDKKGFNIINGECKDCPLNSAWSGSKCSCNTGYVQLGGACIFTCGKNQVLQNSKCVCNPKSISVNSVCQQCPVNSSPNKQKSLCFCNDGFKWEDVAKGCIKFTCPQNSYPQVVKDVTQCVCADGFILQNNVCVKVGKCPLNSAWSQSQLCCICTNPGQFMVNNECRKCGVNQEWSQRDRVFVCKSGFNFIAGECKSCQIGQNYNGVTCECNLGSYRATSGKCQQCHTTCGTCTGPANNQCITCADVTFNFKSGSCVKDTACPKGLYQKGSSCSPCSTYCSDCKSQSTCNSCIDGFQMQSITYGGVAASYCVQKCGDGKRFQLDCDDGNNKNGDGCSADCKVQSGWSCIGGSSIRASQCTQGTPERTYLETTGTVHLYGRIVQGVRLSYIPDSLTANDCAECYNLLWVRVIRSDIVPGVRVNYLPKSKYQFLVQFQFNGAFSIPTFNIAIQINPEYSKYFSRKDMAQIQIKSIDPAVLAMKDVEQQLSLNDIAVSTKTGIKISTKLVGELFN